MDTQPPHSSDPDLQALYGRLAQTLCAALPPPIGDAAENAGSSPDQALARRDAAAIALITSLAPADDAEGALAVHCVVASARANHCLSQVGQHPPASDMAMKLRRQYARYIQESLRSRGQLLTIQGARYKRERADAAARQQFLQYGEGQGAGDGLPTPGGSAEAPPAQPHAPPAQPKPAAPRRSPPSLRLIQGGLAN
jgi:hypothetical protein